MPPKICKNNSTVSSFEDSLPKNWELALIDVTPVSKNNDGNLVNKSGKIVPTFIIPKNDKVIYEDITPELTPSCKCSKKPYLKIIFSKIKESFNSVQELKQSFEKLGKRY